MASSFNFKANAMLRMKLKCLLKGENLLVLLALTQTWHIAGPRAFLEHFIVVRRAVETNGMARSKLKCLLKGENPLVSL